MILGSGILGSRVQARLCEEEMSRGPDAAIGKKANSSGTGAHAQDTQKSLKRSRDNMEEDAEGEAEVESRGDQGQQVDDQRRHKKLEMGDFVAMPDVEDGE